MSYKINLINDTGILIPHLVLLFNATAGYISAIPWHYTCNTITDMVKQIGEEYSLPLKTSYNTTRGFYIQLYSKDDDVNLPGIFMKVTKHKNTLSFTCPDLVSC